MTIMKILLYFEYVNLIKKSGIGKVLIHQEKALTLNNVEYTLNYKEEYDIIHINTICFKSYKFAKRVKKLNKFVIVHIHSTIEDYNKSFRFWKILELIYSYLLKRMCGVADVIITPTEYSKKVIENYPFIKCQVINISNGVDLRLYKRNIVYYQLEETLRKYYGIPLNTKLVLGIGCLFERKGFMDFVKLAREIPDVSFVWLGNKTKLFLTNKIRSCIRGKSDNVYLLGYVDESIVRAFLNMASCYMSLSYEETEGIALLEALACKCPVLVRDIESYNYLNDGIDCYKGNNILEFKKKVLQILNSSNKTIVDNGYKIVEQRSLEKTGAKLKSVYNLGKNK